MNIVKPVCACCGMETKALAVVMDPFLDSCYGVCRKCLASLHTKQWARIGASLDAVAKGETR